MTQDSTKTPVLQVSGRGTNVEFIIDDVSPFDQVAKGIRDYLVENRGMWSGGAIAVNVGSRLTSRDQLNEIKKIIEIGSGLTVIRFSCSPETMAPRGSTDPDTVRPMQHNEVFTKERKPSVTPTPRVRPVAEPAAPPIAEASRAIQPHETYPHHNEDNEVIISERNPTSVPIPTLNPAAASVASTDAPRQSALVIDQASQLVRPPQTHRQHNVVTPEPPAARRQPPFVLEAEQPRLAEEERADVKQPSDLQSQRGTALLVKSTCRSGEIIRHQGDVVVLGDVNPGAEVVASGDIVVFGCLRGFAHAGSEGNTKATIVASSLGSPRVQIGPHVGVSSGNNVHPKYTDSGPVIAYVRRRSIHVALFEGRFFKYGKGELYDG